MPKIKDPNVPSHDASLMHHGAIPIEMMPDGVNIGDMFYWDGNQWQHVTFRVGGSLDLNYNPVEKTLELYLADDRVYGSATMDAIVLAAVQIGFTADATLV